MNGIPLTASAREGFGKGSARKLRRDGSIPALVYSKTSATIHISVDPHELRQIFQKSGNPNTLLSITVDGNERVVLLKDSQKHPVTRNLLHVDFYEVQADQEIQLEVAIRTVGKSEGEKLGGRLQMLRRTVPVVSKPADIPAFLEVDVSHLQVDEFLSSSSLTAPDKTRLAYEQEFNVLLCVGKRILEEEEEEELEEGEGEGGEGTDEEEADE